MHSYKSMNKTIICKSYAVYKKGYVSNTHQMQKRTDQEDKTYYRIQCESGACERCQQHNQSLVSAVNAVVGENVPPFHPNCKCSLLEQVLDPWAAENLIWAEMQKGSPVEQLAQKLIDFYQITEVSKQFISRILLATKEEVDTAKRMKTFFQLLQSAPKPIGVEMELPGEDVNFSQFRWGSYDIFGTSSNQRKMQNMAYTDQVGFRKIKNS